MRWEDVTAVFGGTFDPAHFGHREAVLGLLKNPGVKRVLVIPSATPPQKISAIPSHHRVEMAKLCFAGMPNVVVDEREIERAKKSAGPSYSYDTLQELRQEFGQIAFALGSDQFANLPSWYRFPEIVSLCDWIILARKPGGEKLAQEALQKLRSLGVFRAGGSEAAVVETSAIEVSSRNIREKLARATPRAELEALVPSEILSYLMEQRIYGTGTPRK